MSDTIPANILALAESLTDYEFEMLLRCRARKALEDTIQHLYSMGITISEYYRSVHFNYGKEGGKWTANLGSTYETSISVKGEVLSLTLRTVTSQLVDQSCNKVSLLLAAPAPERVEPKPADTSSTDLPF